MNPEYTISFNATEGRTILTALQTRIETHEDLTKMCSAFRGEFHKAIVSRLYRLVERIHTATNNSL